MKKFAVLMIFSLFVTLAFAQKKNGTVFIEHKSIDETRQIWKAFVAGDIDTYRSYFADSIGYIRNGGPINKVPNGNFGGAVNWWKKNVDNVMVKDDAPAYPDAIEYNKGGLWVQDWIVLTGTHRESGINIELHIHNLYAFNEDGKIGMLIQYFDDDIFEDINNSALTKENGTVYINHPYIATVRKLVNAYAAEDLEKMKSFYDESAQFSALDHGWDESIDLETRMGYVKDNFANAKDIHFKQIGYPDCIFYELNNGFVVYSWWEYSFTREESGEKVVMPLMLSHSFNDDGKIVQEMAYLSTNHFSQE